MKEDSYWLHRHHTDVESLLNGISSANLPKDFQLKLLFLIAKGDIFKAIREWVPHDYDLQFLENNESMCTIKLAREIKKGKVLSGTFNLARHANTNVYVAITTEKQKFVKNALIKFFDNYYSELSRLHLTSGQIQTILDKLKAGLNCEIITDRVISYSRLNKKKFIITGKKPRFKESDVRWTEEDYKSSFQRAAENDKWIDKISFCVQKENKINFYASLSRDGLFKCDKNADEFYKIIIKYLVNIGNENIDIFSNKSRLENDGNIKPIAIEYANNLFEDVEQNKRLIRIIAEFPKSSYSVYHGNPYLHTSVVDYVDGSSYDLWVVSADKIIIIPQIRATFNSLSRFCEHILKRFSEGHLADLKI